MNIFLCYGYDSHTAGAYFERALGKTHDVHYIGPSWRERLGRSSNEDLSVLVEDAILPKPDLVLFIESGRKFFPRGLEKLECPTAGYLIDVHQGVHFRQDLAKFFDHIFLCHKDYISRFTDLGHRNVHWVPMACDPEMQGELQVDRDLDVAFVGGVDASPERRRLLLALEARYKMNDFRKYYPKEDITKVYSRSKIVFNYAINEDLNMRVFEALAGGALLLTNHIENGMSDLFRVGKHFVEYRDRQSMFDKVDYYLSHEDERAAIGNAGKMLVTREHTYEHRSQAILDKIFSGSHPSRTAMVRSMTAAELRTAYGSVYTLMKMVDPAFDEFSTAWAQRAGRLRAARGLGATLLKRLNEITKITTVLKRGRPSS